MIKIGVTGVIGSGKSTAVKYFSSLGVPVFIADDYAKKLMNEDDFLKSEIIKIIGANAYKNNELKGSSVSFSLVSKQRNSNSYFPIKFLILVHCAFVFGECYVQEQNVDLPDQVWSPSAL